MINYKDFGEEDENNRYKFDLLEAQRILLKERRLKIKLLKKKILI